MWCVGDIRVDGAPVTFLYIYIISPLVKLASELPHHHECPGFIGARVSFNSLLNEKKHLSQLNHVGSRQGCKQAAG